VNSEEVKALATARAKSAFGEKRGITEFSVMPLALVLFICINELMPFAVQISHRELAAP